MIDDLLDITSDSETLGKPALHDFAEGKTTLPYIYLYEKLDGDERKKLARLHGKTLTSEEQEWIRQRMEQYRIILRCYTEAKELIDEAAVLMDEVGEEALSDIAREMIERDF